MADTDRPQGEVDPSEGPEVDPSEGEGSSTNVDPSEDGGDVDPSEETGGR